MLQAGECLQPGHMSAMTHVFHHQITSRINDWRSNFAIHAKATLARIFEDLAAQEPGHFEALTEKADYVDYLLGDGKKAVPFHWEEWNEGLDKKVSGYVCCKVLRQSMTGARARFK